MSVCNQKLDDLLNDGYKADFDSDTYINKDKKIVISKEVTEDHDDEWLSDKIANAEKTDEWSFVFNNEPTQDEKDKIIKNIS